MRFGHTIGIGLEPAAHYRYPNWSMIVPGGYTGDILNRETLNNTDTPLLYTTAFTGAGSAAMQAAGGVRLTTTTTASDDADLRTSGLVLQQSNNVHYNFAGFALSGVIDYWTRFSVVTATATEGFIGFIGNSFAALTALPTTASHMGVYWDISVGANFILSSSDNTTQGTTDTTIAVDTGTYNLHIRWSAANAALLELMTAAGAVTGTTRTVTALGSIPSMQPHWFVQIESGAVARTLDIFGWLAKFA